MSPTISVSIVVPVYSGSKYLCDLIEQVGKLRDQWANRLSPMRIVEIILVDDAAIDTSPDLIDQLAQEKSWITAIHLVPRHSDYDSLMVGFG